MEDYSFLLDQMTWSWSRLQAFQKCPYGFLTHYVFGEEEEPTFLASYGAFVHQIHQLVFSGMLSRQNAAGYYLENFAAFVEGSPPSKEVFASYYRGGYDYFRSMPGFPGEIVAVEREFRFTVDGFPFVGIVDLITREDSGLVIYDHKARALKPPTGRKKPTKSDAALMEYTRQLCLYAEAVFQSMGEYPSALVFNCYRTKTMIRQDFDPAAHQEALSWASGLIREIRSFTGWKPDMDYFKCRFLCGLNGRCDYYGLM